MRRSRRRRSTSSCVSPRRPGADAAGLLAERLAPPAQARQAVAQLGQLDLGLALLGAGVLGEDVEDHGGAVDGRAPEDLLEVALCAGVSSSSNTTVSASTSSEICCSSSALPLPT